MFRTVGFLITLCFSLPSLGQPYIPLLGDVTEWHVVTCFNGCGVDRYYASEDVLEGGQHYQVLDGYHYIQGNFLLREDVNERIVYLKLLGGHTLLDEYPLYDFSLEVGDTTHVYNPISPLPEDGGLFVLDSIVLRPLAQDLHRFYYLHAVEPIASQSENTVWVEGVGSLSLINSPGAGPTEGEHTACCFYDGIARYERLDSLDVCVAAFTDVSESKEVQESFMVHPTVFSEHVTVSRTMLSGNWQIEVVDQLGRVVYQEQMEGKQIQISSADLLRGILLIKLSDDSGNRSVYRVVNIRR
ncbi:MAG: T9SS type A sorting domain-containing protein [Flavobacteriales bacterium]|nr:T9SS type A sorting domain-containing protein [Flavobacteriales bacterium]